MPTRKESGDAGEQEVINLIKCPNCKSKFMLLPKSFPLFDVQCTRCLFRAQIKTSHRKSTGIVQGAGWDIYENSLKVGNVSPPIIVNYHWNDREGSHHEILFYPFIPKENLRKRRVIFKKSVRKDHMMFDYINLQALPSFPLYKK